jgi:hypothetical protein
MATHLLLRCAWQFFDQDPKNQWVITPHFRRQLDITDPTSGTDAQALADDLRTALGAWAGSGALTVTAYNVQGAKPNYPMAISKPGTITPWTPSGPPELAVALSFYGGENRPRKRGRVYIPYPLVGTPSSIGLEVPSGTITKIEALAPIFSGLGGTNVDWIVWSKVNQSAAKVTNFWVDNAWDVQRRRGLPPTARVLRTTGG